MAEDDGWSDEMKYWNSIKDKSKYKDKWVAISGENILAYGKDTRKVYDKATKIHATKAVKNLNTDMPPLLIYIMP